MSTGIFLVDAKGELTEMRETPFLAEAHFQELLARYPSLLAGDQIDPQEPRRWLLIDREVGIEDSEGGAGRWAVDHLFVDQEGTPTLVELKRATDTRLRREVVGQMLDYAANASVFWQVDSVRSRFEVRCQVEGRDPSATLADVLGVEIDAEELWKRVSDNLREGRLRLLFVADAIPPELRRVVEFLNAKMPSVEVLAVELKHYAKGSIKTLVPRVYGHSLDAEAVKRPRPATRVWDEPSLMSELERQFGLSAADVARRALAWARKHDLFVWWGKGAIEGSFYPELIHKNVKHLLFAVWTYGKLEIQFQYLRNHPPFDDEAKLAELLRRLNELNGISIPPESLTRRPNIPLKQFEEPGELERLLAIFEWALDEIRKT